MVEITNSLVTKLYQAVDAGIVGNARADVEAYVAELERVFESLSYINRFKHVVLNIQDIFELIEIDTITK